jgi:hypothetical protein
MVWDARHVRVLIALLLVTSACFQSAQHRRYAKIGEALCRGSH